jgi:hypothetical protein
MSTEHRRQQQRVSPALLRRLSVVRSLDGVSQQRRGILEAANEWLNSLSLLEKMVEASGVSGMRKNCSEKSSARLGGVGNGAVNN